MYSDDLSLKSSEHLTPPYLDIKEVLRVHVLGLTQQSIQACGCAHALLAFLILR
jgi:hypothetical protein